MLTLLVPQGAEYQAVCRGLKSHKNLPKVVALPIGTEPVTQFLKNWQRSSSFAAARQSGILVMGLCGSLTAQLRIGDRVLYKACLDGSGIWECDRTLTTQIQQRLREEIPLVQAFTSDRIIATASKKQRIGQIHPVDVVDMEGSAILTTLRAECAIAMLRVVSDDTDHDLPDLSAAISPEGTLRSLPLAIGMIRQPIAALRLIRGSLIGLRTLEAIAARLG